MIQTRSLALLACLAMLAVLAAACGGDGKFAQEAETEKAAVKLVRDTARGGYDLVSSEQLKEWTDQGKDMLVVDTMPFEASYAKAHIPGAKQFLFPIPDMAEWSTEQTGGKSKQDFADLLGPDKSRTIVIYCGFVKCTRSHNGAAWAKRLGYENVYRHPGGIYAWKGLGYPVESVE
ncbi:rhodanese-like domain-containing protein [Desulfohalovibrio reitneri]|uniref:rhodanese-like domain-containing protein n=1 Tax=Desulfohalovibrio reitneri TaxID=1307759 RepID=UPI0004A71168|nr:rhodanese-like domain-containing protein [Desulfohalovibrio reitneri]